MYRLCDRRDIFHCKTSGTVCQCIVKNGKDRKDDKADDPDQVRTG